MVETRKRNRKAVWNFLTESGYAVFGVTRAALSNPGGMAPNTFFIHKEDQRIQDWASVKINHSGGRAATPLGRRPDPPVNRSRQR
jgi:hypothetical protein